MRRRVFIRMIAGYLLIASFAIHAQQTAKLYRIGYLRDSDVVPIPNAFWDTMRELGWVEGQNVKVDSRYAPSSGQLPNLAAELVSLKVDLILTIGTRAAQAAKHATQSIPVVFSVASDPVASGLVASLAKPSENLTGFALGVYDGKLLEVLKEALPGLSRVAYPAVEAPLGAVTTAQRLETAGRVLGVQVQGISVKSPGDFGRFYAAARRERADAVMIPNIAWFAAHFDRIAAEATRSRLPAIGFDRRFVDAGGLMSYGPKESERWTRLAAQVDRILKGAKPRDLPVEQPTKFELIVNLNSAKALGVRISQSLLLRADEVIE